MAWKLVPEFTPEDIKEKYSPEYISYLASLITIKKGIKKK